jgi:CheY-like chemotaxis protein
MHPIKILLVDDSKSARYALRLEMQRHEAVVQTAGSAETALELIRADPPDAVFMDHTMPGMNGFEALEILKSDPTTRTIPVVICTSNEDPAYRDQALRKGAVDVLTKPTAKERLPSLLNLVRERIANPPPAGRERLPRAAAAGARAGAVAQAMQVETSRLIDERLDAVLERRVEAALGDLVARRFEQERNDLARLIQELIDTSLDTIDKQPELLGRISAAVEASALKAAEESARQVAEEVLKELAEDQARAVARGFADALRSHAGTMYALSAAAALAGIGAAIAVYLSLS